MNTSGDGYVSSFENTPGVPLVVDEHHAVFTICSRSDVKHGGHAYCFLEWHDGSELQMTQYDLRTPGYGRVQLDDVAVEVVRVDTGNIDVMDYAIDGRIGRNMGTTKHHSYQITSQQAQELVYSFNRFKVKNDGGRYIYSKPGGKLGRAFGALMGKRGINCADLVLKMLSDAGISYVDDKLINTPRYAAGSSNR